jgi:biopolymer transport protein ExbB/TolQ
MSSIIIIERWIYFNSRTVKPAELLFDAGGLLDKNKTDELKERFRKEISPAGYVLSECLTFAEDQPPFSSENFEEVKSRAIAERIPEMERYLTLLATLGSVSPFIGLLGTVIGIIRAFVSLDMGGQGASGLNAGIAESLFATAGGLLVAIPSTMAYNLFKKKVEATLLNIEIAVSRLKMLIVSKR